jgi:hypothetical protein
MGGNFSMNCFPNPESDQADEDPLTKEDQGTQVPEQTSTEPTDTTAGSVEKTVWTKLDRELVDKVWLEIRKDGDKPSDEFIRKAIKDEDFDNSGVLEKSECKRLCESFQLRAKKNGDIFSSWEEVFCFLDKNGDDTLDFEDVRYTMTVMWLMTKDRLSLKRVTAPQ